VISQRVRRPAFNGWPVTVVILAILALYFARLVLIPLALAITMTFILAPAVAWLQKIHLGRTVATLIVISVAIGLTGFTGSIVFNQFLSVIDELPKYKENIVDKAAALRTPMQGTLRRAADTVSELSKEIAKAPPPAPDQHPPKAPTPVQIVQTPDGLYYLRTALTPIVAPLEIAGVALIFTVFMLIKREDLRNRLFRLGGLARINMMTQALDDAAGRVSRYLLLQVLVNGIFGALIGLGLFVIGVPAATLWGVLAGLARFIPYAGTIVVGALTLLLTLAVSQGWVAPLLVLALFAVLELIIGNLVEPWLYGSHTGVSPLALLVATTFWTMIWGWAGLILATPLTVCLSVLGRHVRYFSFLHVLLGDEEVLSPAAHFYQRLLAMDQDEARTIAERFLADQSLREVYDQVMVPALSLAEQDRHKGKLDEARENFIFLSSRELIAEFGELEPNSEESRGRVLCVPAADRADWITASMLAQLLQQQGFVGVVAPEKTLARMTVEADDILCISALPPFASARAQALVARFRTRWPRARIIVGLWGHSGDVERSLSRFGRNRPDRLCTTLEEVVHQALEWREPVAESKA